MGWIVEWQRILLDNSLQLLSYLAFFAMTAVVASLEKIGWHVTETGLKKLSGGKTLSETEIVKLAQDTDIKDYGKGHIPENWSKKDTVTIEGVLQVQKVRNVAAPKANEESQGAPRLLRVTLSDGVNTVTALEAGQPWSRLSLRTPPGAKVRLRQAVPVCCGFLLVPDVALQLIGGNVQLMVDKWLMAKAFASQSLRPATGAAGGPPPWVPFGKNISAAHKAERNFKSLAGSGEEAPVDAEFEAQRRAQIAQLASAGRKQFGGGTKQMTDGNLQTLMGAGFTQEESEAALKYTYNDVGRALQNLQRFRAQREGREGTDGDTGRGRGRGRGGGRRGRGRYEEEDEGSCRPSEPVTLLDFVGGKIGTDSHASSEVQRTSGPEESSAAAAASSLAGRRQEYDRDERPYRGGYGGDRGRRGYGGSRGGYGGGYGDRGDRGGYGDRGDRGRGYSDRGRGRDAAGGYGRDRAGGDSDAREGGRGRGGRGGGRGGAQRPHTSSDEFVEGRRARERRRAAGDDSGGGYQSWSGGGGGGGGGGVSGGFDGYADDKQEFPDLPGAEAEAAEPRGGAERVQSSERAAPTAAAPRHRYTEGEMCLARYWEDKKMYLVRVISVGERTAVVNFVDYGEHYEEVLTSNMKPLGFEEEEPVCHEEPRPSETQRKTQSNEESEISSLFIHNRRSGAQRAQTDREDYGSRPQRHNGTDGGDTYRNGTSDTYRNNRHGGDGYRNDNRSGDNYRNDNRSGDNYRNDNRSGDNYRNDYRGGDNYRNDYRGGDNYRNDYRGGDNCRNDYRGGGAGRGGRGGRSRGGRGRGQYEDRPPRYQHQDRGTNHDYNDNRPPRDGYQERGREQRQYTDGPPRGGGGGGGRGRGRYEENGSIGGGGDGRGRFEERYEENGPSGAGRGQRRYDGDGGGYRSGGGGQRGQRQWMDTAPSARGRGRGPPPEHSDDIPFTGTVEFRRGGRRPFVSRGSRAS